MEKIKKKINSRNLMILSYNLRRNSDVSILENCLLD